jgi:CRISPR-associated protein Cas2
MSTRRLYLVAYDIAHPRRLRRALHTVRAHASGGQKSAHECFLTEGECTALLRSLRKIIRLPADRVLALRLDPRSAPRLLGIARQPRDGRFLIIG